MKPSIYTLNSQATQFFSEGSPEGGREGSLLAPRLGQSNPRENRVSNHLPGSPQADRDQGKHLEVVWQENLLHAFPPSHQCLLHRHLWWHQYPSDLRCDDFWQPRSTRGQIHSCRVPWTGGINRNVSLRVCYSLHWQTIAHVRVCRWYWHMPLSSDHLRVSEWCRDNRHGEYLVAPNDVADRCCFLVS